MNDILLSHFRQQIPAVRTCIGAKRSIEEHIHVPLMRQLDDSHSAGFLEKLRDFSHEKPDSFSFHTILRLVPAYPRFSAL